jgi:hypothetical protein
LLIACALLLQVGYLLAQGEDFIQVNSTIPVVIHK